MIRPLLEPARYDKANETNQVAAATPIETDLRMLAQQGAFTVHSSPKELSDLKGSDRWLCQIMIPEGEQNQYCERIGYPGLP